VKTIAKHLAVLLLVALAATAETAYIKSTAQWLCYPEPFAEGIDKPRFFRTEFEVKKGLVKATIHYWMDDAGNPYINETQVLNNHGHPTSRCVEGADCTKLLTEGKHVLSFIGRNLASVGGVIARLELKYEDGTATQICSTNQWKTSRMLQNGWQKVGFDDSTWPNAKNHSDAITYPWMAHIDMSPLLTPDEIKLQEELTRQREERHKELLKKMESETKPQCKIVYHKGKPQFDIGGKRYETLLYNTTEHWASYHDKFARQVKAFAKADIHLFGLGVEPFNVWKEDGSIDYKEIDKLFRDALDMDPEAYFMFCISTYRVPRWWVSKHPEEVIGYANGKPDIHVFEVTKNYMAPSYASKIWRRDIADVTRRIVEYIEKSPYSKRVFAYRNDYGVNHEWHYYGMFSYMPDTSKPMTESFRNWLRQNYNNNLDELRKAWSDNQVTFENAQVPGRELRIKADAGNMRHPTKNRQTIDFLRCLHVNVRDCLFNSNKAAKEACSFRALVGNYCGYFFGMPFPAEGWHLENDAILDSEYVDFQSSPHIYGTQHRNIGEPQYARCLLEAHRRRGKLALLEADNQPHTAEGTYCHYAFTANDTLAILARDFCQTLAWGCGFWYFDFGAAWYAQPFLEEYFKKLQPIRQLDVDNTSASEVLFVGDYESAMFTNITMPSTLGDTVTSALVREFGHAGIPFDTASFNDLASGELKDYKVYVLSNLFYVTPQKRAVVEKLQKQGKTIIWTFAPGYLTEEGTSLESMEKLTGFDLETIDEKAMPITTVKDTNQKMKSMHNALLGPIFHIVDKQAKTLGTIYHKDRELVTYAAKNNNVLCTTAFISRQEIRRILKSAKVHIFNDDNDISLYANNSFVAIHSAKPGPQTINLPQKAKVTMMYPEKKLIGDNLRSFTVEIPAHSTTLFLYE